MEGGWRPFFRRETIAHLTKMYASFDMCRGKNFQVTFFHDGAFALFALDEVGRLQCRFKTLAHVQKQDVPEHEHLSKKQRHHHHL